MLCSTCMIQSQTILGRKRDKRWTEKASITKSKRTIVSGTSTVNSVEGNLVQGIAGNSRRALHAELALHYDIAMRCFTASACPQALPPARP